MNGQPDTKALMAELQQELASLCVEAEDACRRYGLRALVSFTLVCRDPENDAMAVVVSNDENLPAVGQLVIDYAYKEQTTWQGARHEGWQPAREG